MRPEASRVVVFRATHEPDLVSRGCPPRATGRGSRRARRRACLCYPSQLRKASSAAGPGAAPIGRKPALEKTTRAPGLAGDQRGATALEYAFIAGLAAILIVAAVTTIGTEVSGLFQSVTSGF